jgi:4-aminobutyrate aminotransferase
MGRTYDDLASVTAPTIATELPGPHARRVLERDAEFTSPSLPRAYPLVPARGAGAVVEDVDGNVFIDFNAGIAVCSTGHSHPEVVSALKRQSEELLHYSASDFFLPIYSETCARLDEIAPFEGPAKSFLTNSGTEAVEAAIKLARLNTRRQYIIGFFGAFHGRSYGSVTLTASNAKYKSGFGPMLPGIVHAPYADRLSDYTDLEHPETPNYIEEVLFTRTVPADEVAAIILEPILGEGGYVVPPRPWVENLRRICDENGILLIADEVQSGMGRTGKMWAIEHFGVVPDIVAAGKGIASGLPLGAMIAKSELMTWSKGAHGSTYGGNPLSCAAALVTIDLIEKELMGNANEIGSFLLDGLEALRNEHTAIVDVRGRALMIGVEFTTPEIAHAVEEASFHKGVLVLGCGDKSIRMSPPLMIDRAQAEAGLRLFSEAVAEVVR